MKQKIIFGIFVISTSLILLNRYSNLSLSSPEYYWLIMLAAYSTFFISLNLILKDKYRKATKIIIIILIVICICLYKMTYLIFWKTQTIEYRNVANKNKSIEFQMRDLGAFGYKTRVIEKIKIIPNINWIKEIDTNKINKKEWKKIEMEVNEMKIKFP